MNPLKCNEKIISILSLLRLVKQPLPQRRQGLFKVGKNTFLPQIYTDKHEIKKQIKIKLLLYLHYYQSSSV